MKVKKTSLLFVVTILFFSLCTPLLAKPNRKNPIFMGEVLEVSKDNSGNTLLLVDGYLKTQQVSKQNVVAVVGPDTKILNCEGEESNAGMFEKGDVVFIVLSEAMTFSIPPQSVARKIKVCKPMNNTD